MPQSSRKDLRIERYKYARNLGYTPTQARQYRDYSKKRIDKVVREDESRLSQKSRGELSEGDRLRLQSIRSERDRERKEPERRGRTETEKDRLENFKYWSKRKAFPTDIQNLITKINVEAGYDEYESYGYRIYYWLYVKQRSAPESVRMVETRDT